MPTITILGLGAGDLEQLPLGIYRTILKAEHIYLRTREHPVVRSLEEEGVTYTSFDFLYEKEEQFENVYEEIVSQLLQAAVTYQNIVYAVPGHPFVAERTIQLLLEEQQQGNVQLLIKGGQSFIDPMLTALQVDPVEGLLFVDALTVKPHFLQPECDTIITQVYDAFVASEVKLTLMEVYPDEYPITLVTAAGIKDLEQIQQIPLYELDRIMTLSNLTAIYVPRNQSEEVLNRQFHRSREIFRQLRGPNGCPWDKKQTHQTLKKYMLEEANEVLEAIDEEDYDHLAEELGDVLLQVFLHAQIAEDEGYFTMEDVLQSLNEKMIRRHPHVFGDTNIENAEEVVNQWHKIKAEERQMKEEKAKD